MNTHHSKAPRAFTLIETVVSLSVMSVLFLGLSGAVMIGSKAIPTATQIGVNDQAAIDALNRLRDDLRQTVSIQHRTSGADEGITLILYDSATPGKPTAAQYTYDDSAKTLSREDSARAEEVILSNITSFTLVFNSEGSKATSIKLLISVSDTIQGTYETHAILPYKPEVT